MCALGAPALGGFPLHFLGRYEHHRLSQSSPLRGMGVTRRQVHMTLVPPPAHPECPALEIEAMGHCFADTWETAAMRALTTFCEPHPMEVTLAPIGLFPAVQDDDPMWLDRMQHMDYLADFRNQESTLTSVRCMNALYRLQGSSESEACAGH
jgi:hypothetical protein